ncbi:MAG: hypothetical protein HRU48_04750 [Vibrio sp.]|uniref:hypothetical protein n=1 Tax=Vibrio TaxID=662 RepID=UPI001EC38961|nr:hypothetical protein [Vibrio sp.]NRB66671.1 hypothetical protein [Vibrio sp.]
MTDKQQAFTALVDSLESIEQAVRDQAPDWETIPMLKRPLVAIELAEQSKEQAFEAVTVIKAMVMNFHHRLCELEEQHAKQKSD